MARIPDDDIERIKRETDLVALVQSKGIECRKHGSKDLAAKCPFHADDTASFIITPDENLWHCMGCGAGGSVFDFVMKYEGVSFRHAYEILSKGDAKNLLRAGPPIKHSRKPKLESPIAFDADDYTLTAQVVEYYHKKLKETPLALDYLHKRGITEEAINTFQIGFADRTLGLTLPGAISKAGKDIRNRLKKIGILREETGHEHFNGSVTFPIRQRDAGPGRGDGEAGYVVTEIYGRKIYDNLRPGTQYHLYLPGPHRGIFNPESLKSRELILCESVIDALTFWCAGYKNVTCIYGTEGFKDELLEAMIQHKTQTVYLAYDRDKAGDLATERDTARFMSKGIEVYRVMFPQGMDANEYARKVSPPEKSLGLLLRSAEWQGKGQRDVASINQRDAGPNNQHPNGCNVTLPGPIKGKPAPLELDATSRCPVGIKEELVGPIIEPDGAKCQPVGDQHDAGPSKLDATSRCPVGEYGADLIKGSEPKEEAESLPESEPETPLVEVKPESLPVPALSSSLEKLAAKGEEERQATNQRDAGPSKEATKEKSQEEESSFSLAASPSIAQSDAGPNELDATSRCVPTTAAGLVLVPETGDLLVTWDERQWRIRGLDQRDAGPNLSVLRVNLRLWHQGLYYINVVDLYQAKQRQSFIEEAARETLLDPELIKRDLGKLLLKLEEVQEERIRASKKPATPPAVTMTEEQKQKAMALLKDPKLLQRILKDFNTCGIVGERTNKLCGYLASVSRKLGKPLAIIIQSTSAAGKSSLMEAILALMPPEEKIKYSAMTGQSLYYLGEKNLEHKILAIVEEEGAEKASYALKLLQSEGELSIASTCKDDQGRLKTEEYHVKGPVMIFLTTTAIDIDEELLNRCIILTVDESREQTEAIHRLQREAETLEGMEREIKRDDLCQIHQNAQRLLRPLRVMNRYAPRLTFLSDRTRTRRDHMKYLTLIRTIALLHQYQRETKALSNGQEYVEVIVEDIVAANQIAHEVLGRSLDELPPQTRKLLSLLETIVKDQCKAQQIDPRNFVFSRRQVREWTGWGNTQLKIHLARLEDFEYVVVRRNPRHAQNYLYELIYDGKGADGSKFLCGLIDPSDPAFLVPVPESLDLDSPLLDPLDGVNAFNGFMDLPGFGDNRAGQSENQAGTGRPQVGGWSGGGRGSADTLKPSPPPLDNQRDAGPNSHKAPEKNGHPAS